MHPLAFRTESGAIGMKNGDRVRHVSTGTLGTADEFLSDGEVLVSWDVGLCGICKWREIAPIKES